MNQTLRHKTKDVLDEFMTTPRHILSLKLTLFLLLLYGSSTWHAQIPMKILCGLMLMSPKLTRSPILWTLIFLIQICTNAPQWYAIDNHKYLITYWTFACALAVTSSTPDAVLSINGRLLIGLSFLFAVFWKCIPGEFFDSSFMHYTFLQDSRLSTFTHFVSGLDTSILGDNRKLISLL